MDSSIYGALVRLSQPWIMRYPLMDFHGNQGSINGDGPAAMRYTEGRLTKLAEEGMLQGLKKNNVNFIPTYDDSDEEPETLPAIFPNLLCNPNSGIGVAMACNWAPHNLKEVAQAIYDYMDGKEPMLPGPDFPTGGQIVNKAVIPSIMKTGHGSVKVRAKYEVKNNKIFIYEIPYGQTIESLVDEVGKFCEENKIGVEDIKDQTNNKGIRIVIEYDKNYNPDIIMRQLFDKTNLQTSFSYNQIALVNKTPVEMNLVDCCKIYVNHNVDCLRREINFDLSKAKQRLHIVEGLIIALEDIDNVIKLIKSSNNSSEAKIALIEKYSLSEEQAKAILDMKLAKLAKLEKVELINEKTELVKLIESLEALLADEEKIKLEIRKRLAQIVSKYGDDRRTELAQIEELKEDKEIAYVEPEKCVVVLTENGSIKRIPSASFKTQRRNGKGVKTQEDITSMIIRTNTIDSLMIFSNKGKMYRLLVDNIPSGTNTSRCVPIASLIKMDTDEKPTVIYSVYRDTNAKYVLFVTKKGLVKKTALSEYMDTKKKTGIGAINIKDGDSLSVVTLIAEEQLLIVTKKGQVIRFNSKEIGATGRMTTGLKGITIAEDDEVIAALPYRDSNDCIAMFTATGLGKRVNMDEIAIQKRAGKGVSCYKDENVVCASLVSEEDDLLLVGITNSICVKANDIPMASKTAHGSQIIKGTRVTGVSKI